MQDVSRTRRFPAITTLEQVNNRSQRMLTRILEKGGFEKRKNRNDIGEYWVRTWDDELFSCGDNLITRREKRFSCGEKALNDYSELSDRVNV